MFTVEQIRLLLNAVHFQRMDFLSHLLEISSKPDLETDIEYLSEIVDSLGNLEGKLSYMLYTMLD